MNEKKPKSEKDMILEEIKALRNTADGIVTDNKKLKSDVLEVKTDKEKVKKSINAKTKEVSKSKTNKEVNKKELAEEESLLTLKGADKKTLSIKNKSTFYMDGKEYKISGTRETKKDKKELLQIVDTSSKEKKPIDMSKEEFEKYFKTGKIIIPVSLEREEDFRKFSKEKKETSQEEAMEKIAEILKNNKIDEIIVSGGIKRIKNKKEKELLTSTKEGSERLKEWSGKIPTWGQDLDSQTALYLLNNLNKNKGIYNEGAKSTIINTKGRQKEPKEKINGVRVLIDAGGEWIKFEQKGKTTTLWIDHHGTGQKEATSGTKMMYEIMQKAKILKEKPEWLDKFVNFVNDFDNLTYLKENKNFNEEYFKEKWPNSLYAIAEKIPLDTLLELIKSGKIKNPSDIFTQEQLKGELGKTKIQKFTADKTGKPKAVLVSETTIAELCEKAKIEASETITGIENAEKYENTSLGKVIYHNFTKKIKNEKGEEKINTIQNNRAFVGIKALDYDTFANWDALNKKFFINSNHPNLSNIVEKLNEIDPNCALDVRGVMVFGKITGKLTEAQFLNIIKNTDSITTENNKNLTDDEKFDVLLKNNADSVNQKVEEIKEKYRKEDAEKTETKAEAKVEDKIALTEKTETPEVKVDLVKNLDDARAKYADGYKQFMADRKKKSNFIVNFGRKIFGSKVGKDELPKELVELEKNYDKATVEYGQKLYDDKKTELEKTKLFSEENLKIELDKFTQTEIFNKIIIEEAQKLIDLKAENLPPKEKNLYQKTMSWYMKQNRFTKVAMSVALSSAIIASLSSGAIAAGGGIIAYAGTKYIRGLVGGAIGTAATKLYDVIVKDRTEEKRESEVNKLSLNFGSGEKNALENLTSFKENYASILEQEQKRKRNRMLHKAGIAVGLGGLASYEMGSVLHNINPEQVLTGHSGLGNTEPINVRGGNVSEQISFKPEQVEISSSGAIQTITDLKEKIRLDYPDISKAPASVQDFMKTDSTQEAIKLGFYNPNAPAESAMGLKGSTLGFDEKGNLISHDIKTGQDTILVNENNDITKYNGPMADTDHSGNNTNQNNHQINETDNKYTVPKQESLGGTENQVNTVSGEYTAGEQTDLNGKPINAENILENKEINKDQIINKNIEETKIDQNETNLKNNTGVVNEDTDINKENEIINQTENTENLNLPKPGEGPYFLSAEQLDQVVKTYENNTDKMFPGNEQLWNSIKNSHEGEMTAEKLIDRPLDITKEEYHPLIKHLQKLSEETGLKPFGATVLTNKIAETPQEFELRCLQKATEMGVLDQVKL